MDYTTNKSDEYVLMDCYDMISRGFPKNHKKTKSKDAAIIEELNKNCTEILLILGTDTVLPTSNIPKYIRRAKSIYFQLLSLKSRSPSYFTKSIDDNMFSLVKTICRCEADMISIIRMQEVGGDRIDIANILMKEKNLDKLITISAKDIVNAAIKDGKSVSTDSNEVSTIRMYYITDTGKKYHINDCPYCKGRILAGANRKMIKHLGLEPCKCVIKSKESFDFVTAYVDESIHTSKWDEIGEQGKVGNFSYIICKGNLFSEEDISDRNIIAQGIDYVSENTKTARITESAIGKVMIILANDFEFTGTVTIFSDNEGAVVSWRKSHLNSKLAKNFTKVNVEYISRRQNTKADKLCRSRIFLSLPMPVYKNIIKKCDKYDEDTCHT